MMNSSSIPENLKFQGWEKTVVQFVSLSAPLEVLDVDSMTDEQRVRVMQALYEHHPNRGEKL